MKKASALIAGVLMLISGAFAQNPPNPENAQPIVTQRLLVGDHATTANPIFLLNEMDGVGKLVKGRLLEVGTLEKSTQGLCLRA